jgi:hypothetical protein
VTAELESRWEAALRELKQAEEELAQGKSSCAVVATALTGQLKTTFSKIGERLPEVWETSLLTRQQKKALLRCLIDKVVVHRAARDLVQTRIVWKGGETTTVQISIPVNSLAELSSAEEMEKLLLKLCAEGVPDEEVAERLTALGYRSPTKMHVLVSTVRGMRIKHRIFHREPRSQPRRVTGWLTVTQVARAIEVPVYWVYDRIHNRTIEVSRDEGTGLYLFPDQPATLEKFKELKSGRLQNLRF